MNKIFQDNYEELFDTEESLDKLWGLLLDLAIRGKLVPQDPNDEPASVLLKKIQAEKEKLIAEKKIRKENPLSPIEKDEIPFEIPKSWEWVNLGELSYSATSQSIKFEELNNYGEINYAKVSDMNIHMEGNFLVNTNLKYSKISENYVPKLSIIFPKRGGAIATNKKAISKINLLIDPNLMALKPYLSESLRYIFIWLHTIDLSKLNTGTSVPQVNNKDVLPLKVPLPPLAEQTRIVQKLDELKQKIDLAKEKIRARDKIRKLLNSETLNNLQSQDEWGFIEQNFDTIIKTKTDVKTLRNTILNLAIRGKLVPQDPNDEPASVLLKKIQAEKERMIKEKKIRKENPLPPIEKDEIPFEIPESWEWVRLGDIVSILGDGLHGTPQYSNVGEYYFINGNNLCNGLIDLKSNTKKVSHVEFLKYKKELNDNTVLVSINGTIGNVAFYNNERVILGKSACYFNLLNQIDKEYIKILIKSSYFLNYATDKATATTIENVSLKTMRMFILPLPSTRTQLNIVEKVDQLMQLCNQMEKRIEEKKETSKKLVEVVLGGIDSI